MDLYTDSHHSDITQVMYNKVHSDNQSWDYIFCFQGVGVGGARKKNIVFLYTCRQTFASEKHQSTWKNALMQLLFSHRDKYAKCSFPVHNESGIFWRTHFL